MRGRLSAALIAAGFAVASIVVAGAVSPAAGAAPTRILNDGAQNGGNAQWMETQSVADSGQVQTFVATFLVEHGAGRRITQALADVDWDGTVDANTSVSIVGSQFYGSGTTNFLETSRVTVSFGGTPPNNNGRADVPIRFRLIDDIGATTSTVSSNLHVVDASNSGFFGIDGTQDFPRLTSTSQSATEVLPGANITYGFTCDDVDIDVFSGDDDCDRANIRWRRLDDGTTSGITLKTGINDSTGTSHTMSFRPRATTS